MLRLPVRERNQTAPARHRHCCCPQAHRNEGQWPRRCPLAVWMQIMTTCHLPHMQGSASVAACLEQFSWTPPVNCIGTVRHAQSQCNDFYVCRHPQHRACSQACEEGRQTDCHRAGVHFSDNAKVPGHRPFGVGDAACSGISSLMSCRMPVLSGSLAVGRAEVAVAAGGQVTGQRRLWERCRT